MMISKKTRLVSWMVTIAMLCSLAAYFTVSVIAADATKINSASQFMSAIAANPGGNYILTADLDFSEIDYEAPLCSYEKPFTGTLDGDGYTIKGFTYGPDSENYDGNYVGLFRFISGTNATVKNLILDETCSFTGNAYVGAIAGQNNGKIYDCISYAKISCNPETPNGEYTVMTQNLWSGGELNYISKLTDPSTYNATTGSPRFSGMRSRINSAAPDILALQEVTVAGYTDTYTVGEETKSVAAWDTYLWGTANNGVLSSSYAHITSEAHADRGEGTKECVQLAYKPEKFTLLTAPAELNGQAYTGVPFSGDLLLPSERHAVYAVLQSGTYTNEIILAYSIHLADATYSNDATALKNHIDGLYATLERVYPSSRIFVAAAGDFHSYGNVDAALSGHVDDAKTVSDTKDEGSSLYCSTGDEDADENLLTLDTSDASPMRTVDFVMVNTDAVEVNSHSTPSGMVNGYHPSNHAGVVVKIEALSGSQIGGLVGRNSGQIQRVICKSEMSTSNAQQVGEAIGANKGGTAKALFSANGGKAMGGMSNNVVGVESLTASPSLEVVWKLTAASAKPEEARFRLVKGQYDIISNAELSETTGDYRLPARIGVNGVYYYDYIGGIFNLDVTGIPEPNWLVQDGKIVVLEGTEFEVTGDMNVAIATSIRNVELASRLGVKYYVIENAEEMMTAHANLDSFNSLAVTVFLNGNIDLSTVDFPGFSGNIYFSLDGQGHTIRNWNAAESASNGIVGFFSGTSGATDAEAKGYRGYFIKNVNFDNVHTRDGYGRSVVVGMACGSNDFVMENVHLTNCSTTATGGGNLAGLLYTHNNNTTSKHVTIRNCSAIDCGIYSTAGDFTNSGVISGRLGNGVNYDISDIYVRNFINESNSMPPYAQDPNSTTNGNGFLIGTVEGSTVNIENVGIFDSRHLIRGTENAAAGYELIGRFISGTVYAEDIIMANNTADAVYSTQGSRTLNGAENIHTELSVAHHILRPRTSGEAALESEIATADHTGMALIDGAEITANIAAYKVNTGLSDAASFYWGFNAEGEIAAVEEKDQIRKVAIYYPTDLDSDGDGVADTEESLVYVVGGSTVQLEIKKGDPNLAYIASGTATLDSATGKVTVGYDSDVVVGFVTENDGNALRVVNMINYYSERNLAYYADYDKASSGLLALLEEARKKLADGTYVSNSAVAADMADALEAYQTNFYSGVFDQDRIPEATAENINLYQNQPEGADTQGGPFGYIIMNTDDLLAVKANEGGFTTAQTIYLGADLDLTGVDFVGFGATENTVASSNEAKFNFDGLNHKLSNWGKGENLTDLSAGKFGGLFRHAETSVIKNLTIENADLTSNLAYTSLLFSCSTNGADNTIKLNDSRAAQVIENVHIIDCTLKTSSAQGALFMSNLQPYRASVTFENCSAINSTFDGVYNNHATFVGRTHDGGGNAKILTLRNCLVDNVDIIAGASTNASTNGEAGNSGILLGAIEHECAAVIQNVRITNSLVSSAGYYSGGSLGAGIIGVQTHDNSNSCTLTMDNVVTYGNTLTVTTDSLKDKCYLVAGNFDGTASNIYYEEDYALEAGSTLQKNNENAANYVTAITGDQIAGGEVAYHLNEHIQNDSKTSYFYWTMQDEALAFGTLANRTLMLTVKLQNGNTIDTFYVDGCETVELKYQGFENETFTVTNATIEKGNIVRMGSEGQDAVATAATNDLAATKYPSVMAITENNQASALTGNDAVLDYTINNIDEWMYVYDHQPWFQGNDKITLHLLCDIDLSLDAADGFTGFVDLQGTFDGHNHTIKNWGTANGPIDAKGLWYATKMASKQVEITVDGSKKTYTQITDAGKGMNALKNFKVDNCHVNGQFSAIVFSGNHTNPGNDLAANFTMSGVHVSNSSVKSGDEGNGILISRYGAYNKEAIVTIKDCSVVSCTLNANGNAHQGLIIGKARWGDSVFDINDEVSDTPPSSTIGITYNISDIYLADNQITDTKDNTGLLYGCSEYGTVNIKNVGAVNNVMAMSASTFQISGSESYYLKEVALAGSFNSGGNVNLTDVFFGGNRLTAEGTYLFARMHEVSGGNMNASGVYYDNTDLTEIVDDNNNEANNTKTLDGATKKSEAAFISGEVPHTVNLALDKYAEAPSFWWATEDGIAKPSAQATSAGKLTIQNSNGTTYKVTYPNGGEEADLPADATYTRVSGNVTVSGSSVVMGALSKDNREAVVKANKTLSAENSVTDVTASLETAGNVDYYIHNVGEWLYVYRHSWQTKEDKGVNYFNYPNVTLHLAGDIDLSSASNFIGMVNVRFNFEGHGYTFENWGGEINPVPSRGLFAVINAPNLYSTDYDNPHRDGKAMSYLKDFNVENVHLKNWDKGSSIVCGFYAGADAPVANIPATFTMENIHVRNASMTGANNVADREQGVLLSTYYRDAEDATTVKIIGCSVENVVLDCGAAAHAENAGGLIGKLYAKDGDSKHTFILADNYINRFTLKNGSQRSGLVFGIMEYAGVEKEVLLEAHLYNNAIIHNSITTAADEVALIGMSVDKSGGGSRYYVCLNLMQGNAMTNTQGGDAGKYLIGSTDATSGAGSFNHTNIIDDEALACKDNGQNGVAKGWDGKYITFAPAKDSDYLSDNDADLHLNPADANRTETKNYHRLDFYHGYPAYYNNTFDYSGTSGYQTGTYNARSVYWTVDAESGDMIPTQNGNRTRKVLFELRDGAEEPIADPEQIGFGYTNSEKCVIDDGITDGIFVMYDWRKENLDLYDPETPINESDAEDNRIATVWSYAVFPNALQEALSYWDGKDIGKYFADVNGIESLRDLITQRLNDDYYQKQEAAVAGLGYASMAKDVVLVESFHATYQEANEDASNVPNAADPLYQDAPHFRIDNYKDLSAVDGRSALRGQNGAYAVGTDIFLCTDLDFSSQTKDENGQVFSDVYQNADGSKFSFDGFNTADFDLYGIKTEATGEYPVVRNWTYGDDNSTINWGFLKDPRGNEVKNITFDNINLTGGNYTAIVWSCDNNYSNENVRVLDVGGQVVFENVHVKNSTVKTAGYDQCGTDDTPSAYEQTSFLMANAQDGRTGVDILNCSIDSSKIYSNNNSNASLIGRIFANTSQTINVKNVLISNVEINSYGRSNSLLVGPLETNDTVLNIENVGIFDSKVSSLGSGDGNTSVNASSVTYLLTGAHNEGTVVNGNNILLANNTQYSANSSVPHVVIDQKAGNKTINLDDCFIDSNYKSHGTTMLQGIRTNYGLETGEMQEVAATEILYLVDANGDGEAEKLTSADFKSGKAAWVANQASLADGGMETWLVDQSFKAYPTLFAGVDSEGVDYRVPNQVILTNNTKSTGTLDDYYTNSVDTLPPAAQNFMTTYSVIHEGGTALDWLDAENAENTAKYAATTYYGDADAYIADDNSITLEVQGVICVELTWGEMQFTYDYGTWDPHNLTYQGRGWNLNGHDPDNGITLKNNSNVYTEVLLTYSEKAAETYKGVVGAFNASDAETPDLTTESLVKMDAKTEGYERSFSFTGVPDWEWSVGDDPIVIGTITAVIQGA